MYISPAKGFAFLHSRKVVGSSISARLALEMVDDDIMIGCWRDAASLGVYFNKKALAAAKSRAFSYAKFSTKNFLKGKGFSPTPSKMNYLIKQYYRLNFGLDAGAHSSAASVKKMLGEDWSSLFKFALVRNPWDHAVSDYYWRKCPQKRVSFKEFLHLLQEPTTADPRRVRPPIITNWSVYAIEDQISVDFVGRFERLETDLAKISSELGFNLVDSLPRAKSTHRDKSKSLREHYDDESIELVSEIYRKEIDTFNYRTPF